MLPISVAIVPFNMPEVGSQRDDSRTKGKRAAGC